MEISAEKSKLMTNSANGVSMNIRINGEKLDTVKSFKYLGAVVKVRVPSMKYCPEFAQTTATLARLKTILNDKHISLSSKMRLYVLPGYRNTIVRLRNLDIDSGHLEEIAGHRDEVP